LLLGEPLESVLALPDVGDLQSVFRLGDPVEDPAGTAGARGLETHPVDDLVVLLERDSLELQDNGDGHGSAPLVGWKRPPLYEADSPLDQCPRMTRNCTLPG